MLFEELLGVSFQKVGRHGVFVEDFKVISSLVRDMEILSANLDGELIVVSCQGMGKENRGGDFIFACDEIELFDQGGLSVTVETLQELSEKAVTNAIEGQKKQV